MTNPSDTPKGISLTKFAELCGVSVAAVTNWRARFDDFPAAVDPAQHRLKYVKHELVDWAQRHGKLAPSVQHQKHRLFDDIVKELESSAPASGPLDALAAAAVVLLEATGRSGTSNPLLGPAADAAARLSAQFRSSYVEQLAQRIGQAADPGEKIRSIVDFLRKDFVFMARADAWGEDPVLSEVALELGGPASTVIDPCCGIGTTLTYAARQFPAGTAIVGRDANALRVAVTAALLEAEGHTSSLSVGDAFDPKFTRSCRQLDGTALIVATPPPDLGDQKKRKATKRWVTLLTTTLRDPGPDTVTVLTTPAAWLSRTFLERGDERRTLILEQRIDVVVLATASSDGRRTEVGLTRVVGPRVEEDPTVALLADQSYVPQGQLLASASALFSNWRTHGSPGDRFAGVAQTASPAEMLSIGALVPQQYRVGRGLDELSDPVPARRPTTANISGSYDRSATRHNPASYAEPEQRDWYDATAEWTDSVPEPEPLDLPLATLEKFIAAPISSGAPLPPRTSTTRTLNDAALDGELVVSGLVAGRQTDLAGDAVELITSNKGFGSVRRASPDAAQTDIRRGAVYIQPTEAGIERGITVEFLLAWLASAQVQAELLAMARAGRHRLSLSLHDVIAIRADFPKPAACKRIARNLAEVNDITTFIARLQQLANYRREHLLDQPGKKKPD